MQLSEQQKKEVAAAVAEVLELKNKLFVELGHKLGESCADDADLTGQCQITECSREYVRRMTPLSAKLDEFLMPYLKQVTDLADASLKIPRDAAWLWGGPTPYWFGDMTMKALLEGAKLFGIDKLVYVGGPVADEYLAQLAGFKEVLVQMTNTCRAPQFQPESDQECTENVSKFSCKYGNIVGGMMDDATRTGGFLPDPKKMNRIPAAPFRDAAQLLKKHNPKLQVASVIYSHEFEYCDYTDILPYLDKIVLWYWSKQDLLEFDERFASAREAFPGKEMLLGIFMHDYGCADLGNPPPFLKFHLQKAARLIKDGLISGIVILGDREIRKWPASTQVVLDMLQ